MIGKCCAIKGNISLLRGEVGIQLGAMDKERPKNWIIPPREKGKKQVRKKYITIILFDFDFLLLMPHILYSMYDGCSDDLPIILPMREKK